jgi:hypothetical protein
VNETQSPTQTETEVQLHLHNETSRKIHKVFLKVTSFHGVESFLRSSVGQEIPRLLWNTRVNNQNLPLARLTQSTPYKPISQRSILILSYLRKGLQNGLFPSGFSTKIVYAFLFACYMTRPSHHPRCDHPKNIWQRVQIMELLILQFSPSSCHFIPLWYKYSPKQPVHKHPQSVFFP